MSNLLDSDHIDSMTIDVPDESWKEIIELQYAFWSKIAQLLGYRNLANVEERGKKLGIDWHATKISVGDARSNKSPINDANFWDALCDAKMNRSEENDESRKLDLNEDDAPF